METALVDVTKSLEAEWDDLAERARLPPFLRPGWITAWCAAFGNRHAVCLTVRHRGRLAALLPMLAARTTLRSPTNAHTPLFGILAEDDCAAATLLGVLFRSTVPRIVMSHVSLEDFGPLLRAESERAGRRLLVTPLQRSPYVHPGDPRVAARLRAGKPAAEVRRRRRLLEREGRVAVEVECGSERLDALLDDGFAVEPSGWKAREGTAIVSRPETRVFYSAVARWAAARGWLRLAFLRVNGRAVAFQYSLEQGGVYYLVKSGYDPALHRFGPGKLLTEELLRRAAETGVERFEFLGDDEPWKREWATETREAHLVQAFSGSALGLIASTGSTVYQRWTRPFLKRVLRRGVRLVRRATG